MSSRPQMQFNGLWPTMLARRTLPDFERPTADLVTYILDQEAREPDFTARYQEQNFFATAHSAVIWLKNHIDQTASALIAQSGVKDMPEWRLFSWYNVNRYGDHHAPHTHPHAYLSGTYYVQLPPELPTEDDPNVYPACIAFYDPRNSANMISVGSEPDAQSAYIVRPTPGSLLIWPSPVQHAVHPNLSSDLRITISFNLIIKK